ncbi:Lactonase, 7-bladed beta-propeller-domain-containing protein [Kockovaella imperatae]|uniref:Lactonase, 7-bladed beta-propeller-domain-containing protein n=1 Tax=Kockovaella imperatae TaxID=4999 RepID=A0A1Y1US33_9TREE|nr:Lactonase, 7-bladed beta-propeller-domain-containing protein [Kockovaella imperatae]ORX39995.1 Lactonase, 7-bladed beta-propeller-domain-containing protein [Kockovaella imperatae]
MVYNLLLGGYGNHITYASFDPSTAKIKVHSNSKVPEAPSWIDPGVSSPKLKTPSGQAFYTIAEIEKGQAVSLDLVEEELKVTGTYDLQGSPAYVHTLKDGSGIVVGNYMGGNAHLIPTTSTYALDTSSTLKPLHFPYMYKDIEAPNPDRQDSSHPHQVIEGPNDQLFAPDLGSDRVWIVKRDNSTESGLKIVGHFQCPKGSGPRHGVVSVDEKHLYVLGELDQTIFSFKIADPSSLPIFHDNIAPPTVAPKYRKFLGAAELLNHPKYPGTLYASNRLEKHIKESDSSYDGEEVKGDAIAIVLLDESGTKVGHTSWVRTECDHIRGMMISPDGKFMALAGKDAGGVEIWQVGGEKGQEWKMAAKDESLKQVTTFVWL